MTLVTTGSDDIVEQIVKQLNKLIDVVKLVDLTGGEHIERELMMLKVSTKDGSKDDILRLTDIFRGRVIDVTETTYTIELTGTGEKLDAFIAAMQVPILETVRSGVTGIQRGEKALRA
jgi:acetolactate synthase-1/3 small subunit